MLKQNPKIEAFFDFIRELESLSLIKKVSIILLFEELFECSPSSSKLEKYFELFSKHISEYRLYNDIVDKK